MLESDELDRELSSDYFRSHQIPYTFLKHSNEVIPFLNQSEHLPALILLAMNSLPENGLNVLKQIKTNDDLRHLPVIILGEDTQPELIKECYANGVNTFINKPFSDRLTDFTIKNFLYYWFEIAQLSQENKTMA